MSEKQFDSLKVIDRLEIGPPQVEPNRVTASYTVYRNGSKHGTEFIYRFEEPVFDPQEAGSRNLAAMMTVQVALNYGLFCRKMVLHGEFDAADRKFIQEMAENTAREIYVKKILEPNPFLTPDFTGMSPLRQEHYSQAEIVFVSDILPGRSTADWETDRGKSAVLSSGGKDSLLSYGLMNEAGFETHPLFVNESGRHWYTALNSYRYFRNEVKFTGRVWTNSDRVFNWMLRHLPFIRQNFMSVRSDEYPIRLWTVAVFLFGVLPLIRRRNIRYLIIGDEYDTTRRLSYHGISHFDGLYDQSRYFDNAMTRYFIRKGWGINQFSVLRPLSELLIEKILVKRYPHLQKEQISCHAAHIERNRIFPCGSCEKCRRIVGMLTAMGADPARCGYTPEQIKNCLNRLRTEEVHQESAAAQQMNFLLQQRGIMDFPPESRRNVKEHAEVLKIRIDPERSPLDGIPGNMRKQLFDIFMQYAEGTVRKSGKMWIDFNLLQDPDFYSPYPFEKKSNSNRGKHMKTEEKSVSEKNYLLAELTWPEAKKRFTEVDIALLPVGAIEQHGPHLPLDTDAFDADYLARKVAAACSEPHPLVLPLVPYGVSYHHDDFIGTFSVSNDTLSRFIYEIGMSAARNGITKLIIINGHGGNVPALKFAAQMINRDARIFTTVDTGETSDADLSEICETPNDVHAGEVETSTSLFTRPHLVQMDRAEKFVPEFSIQYLNFSAKRSVEWFARTSKISRSGVLGDPTKASAEKGEKIWEVMIRNLVELVENLKNMSLNEIYEKRL